MHTQFADRDESQVPVDWGLARVLSPWGSEFDEDGFYEFQPNDERSGGNHPYYGPTLTDRRQKETTLNTTLFAKVSLPFGIKYKIGRASSRESVCQYVYIEEVAVSLKKKRTNITCGQIKSDNRRRQT